MCVQIKLCTSVNARQPADSWKLGTAILLSGLLHVVIFLSTSLVPLATPTKFQPRKVVLGSAEKSSSRWPYGWSKLAAADLPSQYLAGCVSAWRVLCTIAFFSLQN